MRASNALYSDSPENKILYSDSPENKIFLTIKKMNNGIGSQFLFCKTSTQSLCRTSHQLGLVDSLPVGLLFLGLHL